MASLNVFQAATDVERVVTRKEGVTRGTESFIAIGVFPVKLQCIILPSFNGLCCKLAKIAPFIYLTL